MMNLFGEEVVEEEVKEEKAKKPSAPSFFEYVNAITYSKDDLRHGDEVFNAKTFGDPELSGFDNFMVVKALGQHQNTAGFANVMNRMPHLPKEMQYLFYMHGIPKMNARTSWAKETKDERIPYIVKRYKCSVEKAKEILNVLTSDQIQAIIDSSEKGGIQKRRRKSKK